MDVVEKINRAPCPDCGHNIDLGPQPERGQSVTCPECWAYLKVVELKPLALSWDIFDSDDEEEEEEEIEEDD